jgi:hypothetical protein
VAGVITRKHGSYMKVEAYLYRKEIISGWETFDEVQPAAPSGPTNAVHPQPRLPSLKAGQRVDCLGRVWSGQQNRGTSAQAVVLVAIVQRRVRPPRAASSDAKPPQLRRYAVVELPGNPNPNANPN